MSDQRRNGGLAEERARARGKTLLRRMVMLYVGILVAVGVISGVVSGSALIGGIAVAAAVIVMPLITTAIRVFYSVRSVRAVGKAGRK